MEILNHEYYTSLEVNKMLKEAGFDWEVHTCRYNSLPDKVSSNGRLAFNFNGYTYQNIAISAPTLDVAQRWLREVKNVVLMVDFNNDEDCEENERYGVTIYIGKERIVELATYPTYEEAQETGIKKVLELILEKGK